MEYKSASEALQRLEVLIRGEVREATVAANTGPYVKPFGGMQRPAPTVSSYEDILRLLKKLEQATKSE